MFGLRNPAFSLMENEGCLARSLRHCGISQRHSKILWPNGCNNNRAATTSEPESGSRDGRWRTANGKVSAQNPFLSSGRAPPEERFEPDPRTGTTTAGATLTIHNDDNDDNDDEDDHGDHPTDFCPYDDICFVCIGDNHFRCSSSRSRSSRTGARFRGRGKKGSSEEGSRRRPDFGI